MPKPTAYQRALARDVYRRRKVFGWSRILLAHIARVRLVDVAQLENPHYDQEASEETVKAIAGALQVKNHRDLGMVPAEDPDVPLQRPARGFVGSDAEGRPEGMDGMDGMDGMRERNLPCTDIS